MPDPACRSALAAAGRPDAFVILRRYARDHNHPLTQLARDVIRGTTPIIHGT